MIANAIAGLLESSSVLGAIASGGTMNESRPEPPTLTAATNRAFTAAGIVGVVLLLAGIGASGDTSMAS